jgi:hypothetical protein
MATVSSSDFCRAEPYPESSDPAHSLSYYMSRLKVRSEARQRDDEDSVQLPLPPWDQTAAEERARKSRRDFVSSLAKGYFPVVDAVHSAYMGTKISEDPKFLYTITQ